MSKQLTVKIKLLSAHNNPVDNASTMATVGGNMAADGNAVVAAKGTLVGDAGVATANAITADTNAHNLALSTTITKTTVNKDSVEIYNAGAVIVEQQYPNNTTKWIALGFETTASTAQDANPPEEVLHGSFSVGDYLATMSIHFDPAVGTGKITYTAEITNADPSDATKYIQVISPEISYTKTTFTINLAPAYLDVNVWIKITAHNTAGASPASVPFGGRKIPSA
jgi:hypothetical protein